MQRGSRMRCGGMRGRGKGVRIVGFADAAAVRQALNGFPIKVSCRPEIRWIVPKDAPVTGRSRRLGSVLLQFIACDYPWSPYEEEPEDERHDPKETQLR